MQLEVVDVLDDEYDYQEAAEREPEYSVVAGRTPISQSYTNKAPTVERRNSAVETKVEKKTEEDYSWVKPGITVKNSNFGFGTITKVSQKASDGKFKVEVKFRSGGVKKYLAPPVFEHGTLKKV